MNKQPQNIILAVSGSIAAYKSLELLRLLSSNHYQVIVVLTQSALSFVQPLSFLALGAKEVRSELMDSHAEAAMSHIQLARWADLLLIAPASANTIAKLANGLADDLLSTLYLATEAQTILAPAMNTKMWQHPATRKNIKRLKKQKAIIIQPDKGALACGEHGDGRLADLDTIIAEINRQSIEPLLKGLHIMITAGPTQEAIDPVRFISNHSSGKMGYALAEAAQKMGAKVTLISGPVNLPAPPGVKTLFVTSAQQMLDSVQQKYKSADVFVACAAVADYHCEQISPQKIKKQEATMLLKLIKNPDIVQFVAQQKEKPFVVGFAAETEQLITHAREKLKNKNLDMVIANQVGTADSGFNSDFNRVVIISHKQQKALKKTSKKVLAFKLLQHIYRSFKRQKLTKNSYH